MWLMWYMVPALSMCRLWGFALADGTGPGEVRSMVVALAAVVALLPPVHAHIDYRVQPGETLGEIARRHGTSVSVLVGENQITDPNRIVAGTVLSIPDGAGAAHHVVWPGETLSAIASRYGVSVAQLVEWNGLPSTNFVMAGQRLSVTGPAAQNVASSGGGTHHIVSGETLSGIASRFGIGVGELAATNGIADPSLIVAGTSLTIPGGWHCPVRGPLSFVNDFGISKASGRFHDGVDIFAPRGTPVVAPVPGYVEQVTGERAGLQFRLHGADGHVYIGTHLDSFAAAGQVDHGTVLGTAGTSGNAQGTPPHLHFEIHVDGQRITNPYPSLRTACG
jgi:murein DD-endopeptidase MepM/ murein hydrolase activator NlpD